MGSAPAKKIALVATVLVLAGSALLVRRFARSGEGSARAQFLRLVPVRASSVVFVDLDALRASPFLRKLSSFAPHPMEDAEYAQFVRDTGFDYERDLGKAFVAFSNQGSATEFLALGEGKFDRRRLESYLERTAPPTGQGGLKVFRLASPRGGRPLSLAFLARDRIAVGNSENLVDTLAAAARGSGRTEWQAHFDRLSGTPAFSVLRRDRAIQDALDRAAPGGFRSPALSALLSELDWISLSGKPDGERLSIVAEGESNSDRIASDLRDFLEGIRLLSQNGLNDPKLREQMNPEEREAYLELLRTAEVEKIDRGGAKSVRLVLSLPPAFLELRPTLPLAAPPEAPKAPAARGKAGAGKPATGKKR
jgi:hypothetical protein